MVDSLTNLPLVSIIVPVFNSERYLRESLDSIINQTYPQIEVLVMDDASVDGSPDIIAFYGDRVKYYRQPQNRGEFGNVNDGITMARGEYVAIYHNDDIYYPIIVEREVEFLESHPEAGAVFCMDIFINQFGYEVGRSELPLEVQGKCLLNYSMIINTILKHKNKLLRTPSSMVRSSVYRDVGPYRGEEFLDISDLEMWLRISRKYPIGILEEYLFRYRHGHDNSSHQYDHLRTEPDHYFQIMDLYLKEGGKTVATPEALTAYEAHHAEDKLMLVINHYILGNCDKSREILSKVQASNILSSPMVQRGRLLVLLMLLRVLLLIPRITFVKNLFYRRWGIKRYRPEKSMFQKILRVLKP